jgi:hypothetical protein
VPVTVLFLTRGVDYLNREDTKALMRLPREARHCGRRSSAIDATL